MSKSKAVVLAFPGELPAMEHPKAKAMLVNKVYGSYEEYIHNVDALIRELGNGGKDIPLFLVGKSGTSQYLKERNAPEHARTLYWEKGGTCVGRWRYIGEVGGDGDFDWNHIKESGIDLVLLGGERSVDEGGHQCVVEIGLEMKEVGLEIRGIKDCIYPLSPSEPTYALEKVKPLMELLYDQAVDSSEII